MEYINKLNYVEEAENTMKSIAKGDGKNELSTSKIRNILTMVMEIYNEILKEKRDEKLDDDIVSRVKYLKMRLAYESGRDNAVKGFVEKANLLKIIDSIGNSRSNLMLFCNYMEALVAYHKFYGGK